MAIPDDIDHAYWKAGFDHGRSVCEHHWSTCFKDPSQCACSSRLFLQSMILPSQTQPGQTDTHDLDTDNMDKQKKSYILGFIAAVGAAKIKVPLHLRDDARCTSQRAQLQSQKFSSTQGWDTIFDKIVFVQRGHDSKASGTCEAWECIQKVFRSKCKPEGCKHPGEFGDTESFFQTELKDLFHQRADVMTLSDGGLRKQKVLFPASEVMLQEDRLQAADTAMWAHELSKAILPQPTVQSLLSSQWVAKEEDCPDQMGHTDWPATALPLEAACPDRPMYLSFLTPVTGSRTLSFWLASHIIVPGNEALERMEVFDEDGLQDGQMPQGSMEKLERPVEAALRLLKAEELLGMQPGDWCDRVRTSVPVTSEPGTMLVFDGCCIHKAAGGATDAVLQESGTKHNRSARQVLTALHWITGSHRAEVRLKWVKKRIRSTGTLHRHLRWYMSLGVEYATKEDVEAWVRNMDVAEYRKWCLRRKAQKAPRTKP